MEGGSLSPLIRGCAWLVEMPDKPPRAIDVSLDLHLDRDPVEGEIHRLDGTAVSFSGWMELAALLERERAAASDRAPPEAQT